MGGRKGGRDWACRRDPVIGAADRPCAMAGVRCHGLPEDDKPGQTRGRRVVSTLTSRHLVPSYK